MKKLLYLLLLILFIFHNDFWLWTDDRLVLGLPVGLTYHVVYCILASALFFAFVKFGWSSNADTENSGDH